MKPFDGELVLLSVVGVTAKCDSIGDCRRIGLMSVLSVEDMDSLTGFAMPQMSFLLRGGTVTKRS